MSAVYVCFVWFLRRPRIHFIILIQEKLRQAQLLLLSYIFGGKIVRPQTLTTNEAIRCRMASS